MRFIYCIKDLGMSIFLIIFLIISELFLIVLVKFMGRLLVISYLII